VTIELKIFNISNFEMLVLGLRFEARSAKDKELFTYALTNGARE
jgi:hypothetical protein